MTIEVIQSAQPQYLKTSLTAKDVPLRKGPPTREELLVYYPAKFTWEQLRTFINSGDLGLLQRDKKLQMRYDEWLVGVFDCYGTSVNYLLNYRLQWGKPDTLSLLTSALDEPRHSIAKGNVNDQPPIVELVTSTEPLTPKELPPLPPNAPEYFSMSIPAEYVSIIQNDWPYSVPPEVEHTLIWTRIPIYHESIVPTSIKSRIEQDGLWGFTGNTSLPPDPIVHLPSCLPALAEWNITLETMTVSKRGTEEEEALVKRTGSGVHEFVRRRWNESEWETAWFVNPPRLQSVPQLAHIHVFARQKAAILK